MSYDFNQIIDRKNTNSLKYDFTKERNRPEDILPLWVADMDFQTAPEIINDLQKCVAHGIYGYSDTKKDYFLSLYNWFTKRHNWHIQESWLVKTPGVVFAIAVAIHAYTKVRDSILILSPVYYPFYEVVEDNDRQLITSSLVLKNGHYEIDFDDVEQKIKDHQIRLFLLCNPHNSVGRVWTKKELIRLGNICLKYDVKIVSDEIHSDFIFSNHQHYVFASLKEEFLNNTITCTAPTKTFNLAGLQISNIFIANQKLKKQFEKAIAQAGYSQVNLMGIVACQSAYEHGEKWLNELLEYLETNLNFLRDFLQCEIPEVQLIEPEGSYLVWLDFRNLNLSDKELGHLIIDRAHLWLDRGSMFGKEGIGFQRINIACPRKILEKALIQLKIAIKTR